MARTKSGVDIAKIKASLKNAGVPAGQIKEITSSLADAAKRKELERERRKLQTQIDKIDAQIVKLGGAAADATPARKRTGKRASAKQVPADKVLAYLAKNKGTSLRREEIAAGMNVASGSLKNALSELVESKKVKRAGQRRGTTYTA